MLSLAKENNRHVHVLLTAVIVILLILTCMTIDSKAYAAEIEYSGTDGNISWALDSDGVLTITGEGNIPDYDDSPWYLYREDIKTVLLDQGLTGIGSYSFYGCSNLTSITIPDSVISIGDSAFLDCNSLGNIVYYGKNLDWSNILLESNNAYIDTATRYEVLITEPDCTSEQALCTITVNQGSNALIEGTDYDVQYIIEAEAESPGEIKVSFIGEYAEFPAVNCSYTVLGHDLVQTYAIPATCLEVGNIDYWTCNKCGKIFSDEEGKTEIAIEDTVIPLADHSWDEGEIITEPTCTEDGLKTYTCTVCWETKEEILPATGHNWDEGTEPAGRICTEEGVKTYTCTECGETKEEIIPATDHKWNDGKITTARTCTKDGVKTYTCSSCGETKTEVLKATGHKWNEGKITTAGTCTKNGVKTYTCSNCGETKTETLTASGHKWNEGKITTKPTYTTEGVKTYTCSVCGGTKTEKIPVIKHYVVTLDPEGGTVSGGQKTLYVEPNKTYGTLPTVTRTGYTFKGWQNSSGTEIKAETTVKATSDHTLYAAWTPHTYKIKFIGNSSTKGTMSTKTGLKYGQEYTLPANKFSKTGYAFKGWNTAKDGSGTLYTNEAVIKNLTSVDGKTIKLYATWELKKYKITYYLKGGKNNSNNPEYFYYNTKTIKLKDPTWTGYTFKGWYKSSKYKTKISSIKEGTRKNIKLYAKWTLKAPTKVKWSKSGTTTKKIKIKWKRNKQADGYAIYRATKKNGKYKRVGFTTNNNYTSQKLKPGKTYYFKVRPYTKNSSGKKVYGAYSKIVKGTTLDPKDYASDYIGRSFRWIKRQWSNAIAVRPGSYCGVYYNAAGEKCVLTLIPFKIKYFDTIYNFSFLFNLDGGMQPPMGDDPVDYFDKYADRSYGATSDFYIDLECEVLLMQAEIYAKMADGSNSEKIGFVSDKKLNK